MIFVNPVPAEFASGEYYDQVAAEYYLSPDKLESDYADVRFERELRFFRNHCLHGTVLDVGCSSGAFLFQLKRRFSQEYQVWGTDVSGPPLAYAESRGIPIKRGSFLGMPPEEGKFDAITFWAILEHVAEPRLFVEKAAALLNPGGFCFVLVPNMKSLAVRLLGSRYRYIYPQHLNYFTESTLKKLVEKEFAVLDLRTMHFNPMVIWQDWRRRGAAVSNQERGALLKRTTAYKQNPMLRPARTLYKIAEHLLGVFGLADNIAIGLQKKGSR
jgi:2-polyprenyl-3-methyl-5-hydroxy-6-metoxy-1,4-benzoquinol methylase